MPDEARPKVAAVYPANGAVDVPLDVTLQARFSSDMDPLSINAGTFYITKVFGGARVECSPPTYRDRYAFLKPLSYLEPSTAYRAVLVGDAFASGTGSLGVKDILGNYLEGYYEWTFTTCTSQEKPAPRPLTPGEGTVVFGTPSFTWEGTFICDLEIALDPAFTRVVFSGSGPSGLVPGMSLSEGTYFWRIRLKDGASAWSNPVRFSVASQAISIDSPAEARIVSPSGMFFPLDTDEIVVEIPGTGYIITPEQVKLTGKGVLPGIESHGSVSIVSVETSESNGVTIVRIKLT